MKKFICVQGSPEIPKRTIAEWDVVNQCYSLYNEKFQVDGVRIVIDDLGDWQVEGNDCWEEVKEVRGKNWKICNGRVVGVAHKKDKCFIGYKEGEARKKLEESILEEVKEPMTPLASTNLLMETWREVSPDVVRDAFNKGAQEAREYGEKVRAKLIDQDCRDILNNATGVLYTEGVDKLKTPLSVEERVEVTPELVEHIQQKYTEQENIPTQTTRWKPKMGQPFYCLDESGFVEEDEWDGTLGDQRKWDIGNCFKTEQEARDEVKRRESIANAWRPKGWDECWIWSFTASKPMKCIYSTDCDYTGDAYIGAIHPTEEACKQWGETYAHLFLPKTE